LVGAAQTEIALLSDDRGHIVGGALVRGYAAGNNAGAVRFLSGHAGVFNAAAASVKIPALVSAMGTQQHTAVVRRQVGNTTHPLPDSGTHAGVIAGFQRLNTAMNHIVPGFVEILD